MTATYEPALPNDRDWVRFLVGDTTTASAQLQDEEIDALVTDEANKHLAAARALEVLYTRWAAAGKGVMEKQVSKLRIKRGVDSTAGAAIQARIDELRARGAYLLTPSPRVFRVL